MKEFEGTLIAYSNEQLTIKVGKQSYTIPIQKIAGSRLAIQF
jgi:ribosome maturation factor RimP